MTPAVRARTSGEARHEASASYPGAPRRAVVAENDNPCSGTPVTADGRSYCVHVDLLSFEDAAARCEREHGHLAFIETADENANLQRALGASPPSDRFWIGLTDREREGDFRWTNGAPITFSGFHMPEPNDDGGVEDCTEFYAADGRWNDIDCRLGRSSICEASPPA